MKTMWLRRLLLASIVALCSAIVPTKTRGEAGRTVRPAAPKGPEAAAAPKRAKVTCVQYRANAEAHAKHAVFNTKLKAGAWGNVPEPLRKLPPGARLCGADGMGQAVIVSPLFGNDIATHYTPLFTRLGFEPLTCKVADGRTQCKCKRHRDIGIVVTDQDSEAFVLTVMKRS